MAENSKARRAKPSNNVPKDIVKDASRPDDLTDVELKGKELQDFLEDTPDNVCAD